MFTVTSQALPAPGPAAGMGAAGAYSWVALRSQDTDKLGVRLSVSLRDRLNDAVAAVKRYPGTRVLRSRNVLIAYACHRLCVDLETRGLRAGQDPAPQQPLRSGALDAAFETAFDVALDATSGTTSLAGSRAPSPPRWPPEWMAGASLYRVPWESELAEPRCQLTLRVPPPFAVRLRARHAELAATPRYARRPELSAVHTFSDLVGLACHELCRRIETDTAAVHPP